MTDFASRVDVNTPLNVMASHQSESEETLACLEDRHLRPVTSRDFSRSVQRANDRPNFQYPPLGTGDDAIRLLRISTRRSGHGLIEVKLSEASMYEAEYTCLSYVWGEASELHTVLINRKRACVRKNLFSFLESQAHAACSEQLYWIDAICIDQSNVSERNSQVSKMGQIYQRARGVHVWLGDKSSYSTIFSFLSEKVRRHNRFGLLERLTYELPSFYSTSSRNIPGMPAAREPPPELGMHIVDFMEDPYWRRAWVVQELILGSKIVFLAGRFDIDVDTLATAKDLVSLPNGRSDDFQRLMTYERRDLMSKSLIYLLWYFGDKECAILHDRVYSVRSLTPDGQRIEINYKSSLADLAMQVLSTPNHLQCFCSVVVVTQSLEIRSDSEYGQEPPKDDSRPSFMAELIVSSDDDQRCSQCVNQFRGSRPVICLQSLCCEVRGHVSKGSRGFRYDVGAALDQEIDEVSFEDFVTPDEDFLLKHQGGIDYTTDESDQRATWRFSRAALLEVVERASWRDDKEVRLCSTDEGGCQHQGNLRFY